MLTEQIDQDLKVAQKEKNETVLLSLRNLKAALKNAELEKSRPLTEEEVMSVVGKKVKQHKDSIESFTVGNRKDLVEVEQAQMAVLQKFLPQAMSEEELIRIVQAVIAETKATKADFGKVMKEVVAKVKGAADGSVISKLVKENLK
ncbi:MAG: GatB/YqeY domain-containing protein [Candidatus Doudnabacteria bacterium]|nr:GatB/YqeY domain-containing protein [Candidatus Doudnabacteria bacterium]